MLSFITRQTWFSVSLLENCQARLHCLLHAVASCRLQTVVQLQLLRRFRL
jgi:hypothetical protein